MQALEKGKAKREAECEIETQHPGYLGSQDTYHVGHIKGIGKIYQQTFVGTYTRVAQVKLHTEKNSLIGFVFGITSSIGFSIFSVTLRWRKETPKFTTVAVAGLFCFVIATIMILAKGQPFFATSYNSAMFSLHGTLVCLGLILYSIGSKAIPAAELTLLSLTEVIGGIFWVWLPLFGINEVPSTNTIVGGFFLFVSLIYYSLIMRWNKRYIALN